MTIRLWIYVVITALLLGAGALTWAHHTGVVTGQITQKITTDKQTLTVAKKATVEATVNAEKFDTKVNESHARTEIARKALANVRERVVISPKAISVNGDTSNASVIPALVKIIHYQDTLQLRSDSEIVAHQQLHRADTATTGAALRQAKVAEELANDFKAKSSPRCGRNCGILIGVGTTLAVVVTFVHFVK